MELKEIKGLGKKRLECLERMGIHTASELISHFPFRYSDFSTPSSLKDSVGKEALILAKVVDKPTLAYVHGKRILKVKVLTEQGEKGTCVWFQMPYLADLLEVDIWYLFYGRVQNKKGYTISSPAFERRDERKRFVGIVPKYRITEGLTQNVMISSVKQALERVKFESLIDEERFSLMPLATAYQTVHFPSTAEEITHALERIAIEELFALMMGYRLLKKNAPERTRTFLSFSVSEFESLMGFSLTKAQKNAIDEINRDLSSGQLMNRMVQGDVGSGKTAVALYALLKVSKSGYQGAFLAPTEVLARQHFERVKTLGVPCVLLTSSMSTKERTHALSLLASGEAKIAVGTHALFSSGVQYAALSLVVMDEQHKFGVRQRTRMMEKGDHVDVLVMSATPIPRTLSLTMFGDLDMTYIKEKPFATDNVKTRIVPKEKEEDLFSFLAARAKEGEKIFLVCPQVDDEGLYTVLGMARRLKSTVFRGLSVAVLHGGMESEEKKRAVAAFRDGETNILFASGIVEVGIDVRKAHIIAIFEAQRFGMTQIHQLRGRVGRDGKEAYCFLLSDSQEESATKRLSILTSCSDGFEIAEQDFILRGAGDFMGTRQHGESAFHGLSVRAETILKVKKIVEETTPSPALLEKLAQKEMLMNNLSDVSLN